MYSNLCQRGKGNRVVANNLSHIRFNLQVLVLQVNNIESILPVNCKLIGTLVKEYLGYSSSLTDAPLDAVEVTPMIMRIIQPDIVETAYSIVAHYLEWITWEKPNKSFALKYMSACWHCYYNYYCSSSLLKILNTMKMYRYIMCLPVPTIYLK